MNNYNNIIILIWKGLYYLEYGTSSKLPQLFFILGEGKNFFIFYLKKIGVQIQSHPTSCNIKKEYLQ